MAKRTKRRKGESLASFNSKFKSRPPSGKGERETGDIQDGVVLTEVGIDYNDRDRLLVGSPTGGIQHIWPEVGRAEYNSNVLTDGSLTILVIKWMMRL